MNQTSHQLKIFLIIAEDHFYHPKFLSEFIDKTVDIVIGAALVTKAPAKANLQRYLVSNFYFLRPLEIIKLVLANAKSVLFDNKFGSVKRVLEQHKVPYITVNSNINNKEYLEQIKNVSPDVIVSSNPWIFKNDLLNIPKICCINRHSSLLPSYGGLWPVFWAFTKDEKLTGVTIHTMVDKIDKGKILSQKEIVICKGDSIANLYKKTFDLSVPVLLEALDKIRISASSFTELKSMQNDYIESYYSFPKKVDWIEFRNRGGYFI